MRVGVGRVVGMLCLVLGAAVASTGGGVGPVMAEAETTAAVPGEAPTQNQDAYAFEAFCDSWMQKLWNRASFSRGRIKWKNEGDTIVGEHVDYGRDRTCVIRSDPGKEPIGKIMYREVRYRRRGATVDAALAAPGTVIERFDVTEIFRYADGRWQY